jgi:hypothetical protein
MVCVGSQLVAVDGCEPQKKKEKCRKENRIPFWKKGF